MVLLMDLPPNLHISDLADKLVAQRCGENRSCPATIQGGARLVDAPDGVAAVRVQALLSLQGVHHHGRGSPADLPGWRQQVRVRGGSTPTLTFQNAFTIGLASNRGLGD